MLNDRDERSDELKAIVQEKVRIEEQIKALQQRMSNDDMWLKTNAPTVQGYQETLEELLALQAYVPELYAQVASLEEAMRDITLE